MKIDRLSARVSHETKVEFTNICHGMGLTPAQAIELFAKAVIYLKQNGKSYQHI